MKMKKLSLKLIVFFAAAAAISVLALVSGTRAYAQAGITVVTGSDAFAAALSDGQCTAIELQPDVIYELDTTVEVNRSLTIRGKGATVNFLTGANIAVTSSNKLMVSEVSLYAPDGHALSISGSLTIGERVMFSGRNGILMRSGSDLTSGGVAVTAAEGLSALVTVETGGGTVLIHDIRLTQTKAALT